MSEENTSPVKYLQVKGRVSGDYEFWGLGGREREEEKRKFLYTTTALHQSVTTAWYHTSDPQEQ